MLAVLALGASWAGAASAAPGEQPPLGAFRGGANVAQVDQFGTWLGRPMTHALDYLARQVWSDITNGAWLQTAWQGKPHTLVLAVPMLPESPATATLEQGALGAYDAHFADLASDLVAHDLERTVIRLGWEFNGNWYRWSAAANPAAYVGFWRKVVTAMRAVPGAAFRFEWAPVMGAGAMTDVAAAYPGNAYVDYIGMSLYDIDWAKSSDPAVRWQHSALQPFGLPWLESFAAQHGKPVVISEWGVVTRDDGLGGGDNPYFVEKTHEWLVRVGAAWSIYFEYDAPDGAHRLSNGQFPRSAAAFRRLFGPDWKPPEPAPVPPAPGAPPAPAAVPSGFHPEPAPAQTGRLTPFLAARVTRLAGRRLGVRSWAADPDGVRHVAVAIDGRRVCRDMSAPFHCRSDRLARGFHVVRVVAVDAGGHRSVVVHRLGVA